MARDWGLYAVRVPGRVGCGSGVRRGLEVKLQETQLNDVVGIADEPVKNAGDVGRVDLRKVRRVERGRLRTRRAVLVRHVIALCSRYNTATESIKEINPLLHADAYQFFLRLKIDSTVLYFTGLLSPRYQINMVKVKMSIFRWDVGVVVR